MKAVPSREPAESLVYDVAQRKAEQQLGAIEKLDTKAATLAGFSSALIGVFGLVFPLATTTEGEHYRVLFVLLFAAGLAGYGGALVSLYHAYRPHEKWDWRPHLGNLITHGESYSLPDLYVWAACEYREAIEANRTLLKQKGKSLSQALLWTGAEVLSVALTGFLIFLLR